MKEEMKKETEMPGWVIRSPECDWLIGYLTPPVYPGLVDRSKEELRKQQEENKPDGGKL